ncbi:MAG: hypothetical protein U5L08_10440 [Xanthomonadales bacterium]|nr:hypothetical protein [Xanthomonadales bacterium]
MNAIRLTTILPALFVLGVSSIAMARGPVDQMTERLDLNDDQAETISALFEQHRDYMQNSIQWRDGDGNRNPDAYEQASAAREALHQEILAVLDDEQAERFEQISKHRGNKRGGGHMARVVEQLDLSVEQAEALQALKAERRVERMNRREHFRAELESILSEDQLAELDKMRQTRRGGRKH